jgi:pyruvate kinase
MRKTRIVCTIGPATRDPETLRRLMEEGMDVARLNFSHGDRDTHAENVRRIRDAAGHVGKPVAIQVDLQGPKLRVSRMQEPGIQLEAGQAVTFTTRDIIGQSPDAIPVQNPRFPQMVQRGDRILLDDGQIECEVLSVDQDKVHCRCSTTAILKSNKGINLPGTTLDLPTLTNKDREDLAHALDWGVDWVALSFVRTPEGIQDARDLIRELVEPDRHVPLLAKIEKPEALENIDAIIEAADAIMVARGDLGIEIPPEKVPMAQKQIIEKCNRAGIPVITATQMLESMVHNPHPTRAEASDVANAILDGTDAIMLSAETSIGEYPIKAVRTMGRIADEVEQQQAEIPARPFGVRAESIHFAIGDAVGRAARETARHLQASALVCPTASGYTARIMSHYRPQPPIIAITPSEGVQRTLMLYWGVTPLLAPRTDNTDEMIRHALDAARQRDLIHEGDIVVITAGAARSRPGTTNLMRVHIVEKQTADTEQKQPSQAIPMVAGQGASAEEAHR